MLPTVMAVAGTNDSVIRARKTGEAIVAQLRQRAASASTHWPTNSEVEPSKGALQRRGSAARGSGWGLVEKCDPVRISEKMYKFGQVLLDLAPPLVHDPPRKTRTLESNDGMHVAGE
eukprot:CAMPEP_0206623558 /NCGR_PEP_ID=MMETSP0325_2-20121206/63548_1 /ASSEMBLY_ACC=CAM_ASM_000347 /TAXON_ID=2866 /ORGANISM="Crypthecodinium cohnii, Strain Seligo" /LENGTH=116 /DNA_ID=CAMNT_0054147247 /DNA_START=474 /DNA_END=822 /DNA_ORIENTATION=-